MYVSVCVTVSPTLSVPTKLVFVSLVSVVAANIAQLSYALRQDLVRVISIDWDLVLIFFLT